MVDYKITFKTFEGIGSEFLYDCVDAIEAVIIFRRFHPGYVPISVKAYPLDPLNPVMGVNQ